MNTLPPSTLSFVEEIDYVQDKIKHFNTTDSRRGEVVRILLEEVQKTAGNAIRIEDDEQRSKKVKEIETKLENIHRIINSRDFYRGYIAGQEELADKIRDELEAILI